MDILYENLTLIELLSATNGKNEFIDEMEKNDLFNIIYKISGREQRKDIVTISLQIFINLSKHKENFIVSIIYYLFINSTQRNSIISHCYMVIVIHLFLNM